MFQKKRNALKPPSRVESRAASEQNQLKELRELIKASNQSSETARNSWMFFLVLLSYLFVTISGISHKDLLFDTPTKLPILGTQVPITQFFIFAPLLLLFVHVSILFQHSILTEKLIALNTKLEKIEIIINTLGCDVTHYDMN